MPGCRADRQTDQCVERLRVMLFDGIEDDGESVASLARRCGLGHETIRRLYRNPGDSLRTGPTFFVVAAIARARGLSLDSLAEGAMQEPAGQEATGQ